MSAAISEVRTVFRDRRWFVLALLEEMNEDAGEVVATSRSFEAEEVPCFGS